MRLGTFPFGLIAFFVYALIALMAGNAAPSGDTATPPQKVWELSLASFTLVSGRTVSVSVADAVIVLGILTAMASVLTAVWLAGRTLFANMISVLVLGAVTIAFLVIPAAGTAVFFVLGITYLLETVVVIAVSMRLKPIG
ncbi:MAG: hypothetical protein AAGJ94_10105 [Pseudomonadota bacterium]